MIYGRQRCHKVQWTKNNRFPLYVIYEKKRGSQRSTPTFDSAFNMKGLRHGSTLKKLQSYMPDIGNYDRAPASKSPIKFRLTDTGFTNKN